MRDITEFQKERINIVTMLGAFIEVLNQFEKDIKDNNSEIFVASKIRLLQQQCTPFQEKVYGEIKCFYEKRDNPIFGHHAGSLVASLNRLLGMQLLPSKALDLEAFRQMISKEKDQLGELMLETSNMLGPTVEGVIKANSSFDAYLFLAGLFEAATDKVLIVDPYVDSTLFRRYLRLLSKDLEIHLITNFKKTKSPIKEEFEAVEQLFKLEYPNYKSSYTNGLHDRYLIIDSCAYSLGGSIKDAAKSADFLITQLEEKLRKEILEQYSLNG